MLSNTQTEEQDQLIYLQDGAFPSRGQRCSPPSTPSDRFTSKVSLGRIRPDVTRTAASPPRVVPLASSAHPSTACLPRASPVTPGKPNKERSENGGRDLRVVCVRAYLDHRTDDESSHPRTPLTSPRQGSTCRRRHWSSFLGDTAKQPPAIVLVPCQATSLPCQCRSTGWVNPGVGSSAAVPTRRPITPTGAALVRSSIKQAPGAGQDSAMSTSVAGGKRSSEACRGALFLG